jgi:hypothetical protein
MPRDANVDELPVFSERLSELLETMFRGEAPNAGRFCGHCYTPMAADRRACAHCARSAEDVAPVEAVPAEVIEMFRRMRRRESIMVNSFAYLGLLLAVVIFTAIFYVLFINDANFWWYVFDIALLFVLARVLAGLVGGFVGDELGYRRARRKLAEEWAAYEAERGATARAGIRESRSN